MGIRLKALEAEKGHGLVSELLGMIQRIKREDKKGDGCAGVGGETEGGLLAREALDFAVFRWCQQGGKFWEGIGSPSAAQVGLEGFMEEVSQVQGSGAHTGW